MMNPAWLGHIEVQWTESRHTPVVRHPSNWVEQVYVVTDHTPRPTQRPAPTFRAQ